MSHYFTNDKAVDDKAVEKRQVLFKSMETNFQSGNFAHN